MTVVCWLAEMHHDFILSDDLLRMLSRFDLLLFYNFDGIILLTPLVNGPNDISKVSRPDLANNVEVVYSYIFIGRRLKVFSSFSSTRVLPERSRPIRQ